MKVHVQARNSFYYPDVSACCDTLDRSEICVERPCLVIEVLSPATASIYRREKRLGYATLKSLHEYIIVDQDLSIKLIDFGLVVPNTAEYQAPGNRTGTAMYMAPELIKRMPTDHRVDVFAFGITAYETCTFELPWTRGIKGDVAMQHAAQAPQNITRYRPRINPKLGNAIMSCLEQDPARRCASIMSDSVTFQTMTPTTVARTIAFSVSIPALDGVSFWIPFDGLSAPQLNFSFLVVKFIRVWVSDVASVVPAAASATGPATMAMSAPPASTIGIRSAAAISRAG